MWFFNDNKIDVLPDNCVGFVYMITNLNDGRKYIGKKLAHFTKTTHAKGKKKRRKIESDWKDYYGSSDLLKEDINTLGKDGFHREILHFCYSKSECSYMEAKEQFERGVLETDDYYNRYIRVRINQNQKLMNKEKHNDTEH